MNFKPNPPKSLKSRAKYLKGYHWERQAAKMFWDLYRNWIYFHIKAPYSYPFDYVFFTNDINAPIWLLEIRYRFDTNIITIPETKLKRLREFLSHHKRVKFRFLVMAFYQSKYNYVIKDCTNEIYGKKIRIEVPKK